MGGGGATAGAATPRAATAGARAPDLHGSGGMRIQLVFVLAAALEGCGGDILHCPAGEPALGRDGGAADALAPRTTERGRLNKLRGDVSSEPRRDSPDR